MPVARGRRCVRVFAAHLFSNVGLVALVVGYVLLGALLFRALEADHELQQRSHIRAHRDACLAELWGITERLNVLYKENWTRLAHDQLRKFETSVVAAAKVEGYDGKELHDAQQQWSFSGALLYSVTVITTIGYGNLAPKTAEGKLGTMLYALVGVPLMLLCLSNLGSLLADTFQFTYAHARCCRRRTPPPPQPPPPPPVSSAPPPRVAQVRRCPRARPTVPRPPLAPEVRKLLTECAEYSLAQDADAGGAVKVLRELREPASDSQDELDEPEQSCAAHNTPSRVPLIYREPPKRPPTPPPRRAPSDSAPASGPSVPVSLVLLVLTAYICLGAVVFAAWEEWSYLDGAYFCFITLSTIGFGDMVPGKSFQSAEREGGQLQLVACCAYLLLGLVLIAMSFSLVQEEVLARCRQAAVWLGLLKR